MYIWIWPIVKARDELGDVFFVWCGSCYFLVGDTLNGMVAGGYAKGISEGCVVMLIHSILSILAP